MKEINVKNETYSINLKAVLKEKSAFKARLYFITKKFS